MKVGMKYCTREREIGGEFKGHCMAFTQRGE